MKLFNRLNLFTSHNVSSFDKIQAYEDIKEIIRRALDSSESYHILFIGAPASGKTLFLQGIMDMKKNAVYFDMSNTTNKILDILEQKRPKIILLDELEKAPRQWQEKLLNILESGRIDVEQQKKSYHVELKGIKAFGTCNDLNRLSRPLQSRFRKIFLPKYSKEDFLDICEKILPKLSPNLSRYIAVKVYESDGDVRSVLQIGKLVERSDTPEDVERIMNTLTKYGNKAP